VVAERAELLKRLVDVIRQQAGERPQVVPRADEIDGTQGEQRDSSNAPSPVGRANRA